MNDSINVCPECGEQWVDGQSCADAFHTLLGWEWEYNMLEVHHLLVLCYHLQHPSLYSPEALKGGCAMFVAFVEDDMTPQQMRKRIAGQVDSGKRKYSITARPNAFGVYAKPVIWDMRIWDCVRLGPAQYYTSIRVWAASILAGLRASGNLDGITAQGAIYE
jgi:hypothetical protein